MERIFVNASAAKSGGAATILNKFVVTKANDEDVQYVIASPIRPSNLGDNQTWVKKSTSLFGTIFYALIGAWFSSRYYKCNTIISFSNVNALFPIKKITYFHNILIIKGTTLKWKGIRSLARLTMKSNTIVVQTPYVRKEFRECFGKRANVIVRWPGIDIDGARPHKNNELSNCQVKQMFTILVPITNTNLKHKNFDLVLELAKKSLDYSVRFLVTTDYDPSKHEDIENIEYVGAKSRDDYLNLLSSVDATIVTSTLETVGLPIFESLAYHKFCFVFRQEYLVGITELFGELSGLLEFSTKDEFISAYLKTSNSLPNYESAFLDGDWNF
ncbi:glycosyltransferase [Vibrio kyushuensis]|uniref:hypothetical protein n=1 Tax=Vibrio kyushuensis TaxID=2910249 RepID=UPI003D0BB65A